MAFARTYKRRVPMKAYRLNRLFNAKSGRCFDVAVDHGFFNERSFLQGIENLDAAVKTLVEADPDAIQLTLGQARLLQRIPGKQKPALVLRTDVANVYGTDLPDHLFSRVIEDAAEQAVRLDAACVVVNLFRIPGAPEVTDDCIQNILDLKPQCDALAIPLMIEPLVFKPNSEAGGYQVDGGLDKIMPLVRQACELCQSWVCRKGSGEGGWQRGQRRCVEDAQRSTAAASARVCLPKLAGLNADAPGLARRQA